MITKIRNPSTKCCIICKNPIPWERRKKDTCSIACGVEKNLRVIEDLQRRKGKFYRRWKSRIEYGLQKRINNKKLKELSKNDTI